MSNTKDQYFSEFQQTLFQKENNQLDIITVEHSYSNIPSLHMNPAENIRTLLNYTNKVLDTKCCLYKSFVHTSSQIITNDNQYKPENFNIFINSINSQTISQSNSTIFKIDDLNIINDKISDITRHFLSNVNIPVVMNNEVTGVLCVFDIKLHEFSNSDIQFIDYVCEKIAIQQEHLRIENTQVVDNKLVEEELLDTKHHLNSIYENSPIGMYRSTPDGSIISANPAFLKILKYNSLKELQQCNFNSKKSNLLYSRDRFTKIIDKHSVVKNLESVWLTKDGKDIHIRENANKFSSANGDVYFDGYIEDITQTKLINKKFENSLESYYGLFQNNTEGIIIFNNDCSVLDINPVGINIFGINKDQILGGKVENIISDINIAQLIKQKIITCYKTDKQHIEVTLQDKQQNLFALDLQFFSCYYFGERSVIAFARNISKKKKYEKKIKTSLDEKQVLLKEIHHRVKNNLQLISSLLSLQSNNIDNEIVNTLFLDTQERIRSIALVHESFYQSNDFSKIDFYAYVRELIVRLTSTYEISPNKIKFHVNINDIFLDINKAIPCGLIINEIARNSIKYAFPIDQKDSLLSLSMSIKNRQFCLIIKDNGVGLPDITHSKNHSKSFGIDLVKTLTKQLKGNIIINSNNGTEYIITFPNF